jgi:hypothetical protein
MPMITARSYAFRISIAVLAVLAGQVLELLLPRYPAIVLNDLSQLAAGLAATISCAYFAARSQSWERRWRLLAAIGMAGWSVGQCIWSWYQIVERTEIPSPSWADAGYLTIAPFGLAALVVFARHGSTPQTPAKGAIGRRLQGAQLVLDGLLIVGSLFLVTWTTALGTTVHTAEPNSLALAIAISYPVTDLTLVAIVFLIYTTRWISREYLQQLSLLGIGLIGLALSDSVFSYLVSSGAGQLPLIGDAGFIFGPMFIALAAAAQPKGSFRPAAHSAPRTNRWVSLLTPYVPLVLAAALLSSEVAAGRHLDGIELVAAVVIFGLVLLRQSASVVAALQQQSGAVRDSREGFQAAADRAVTAAVGQSMPRSQATLEDEICEVSDSLTSSFERLRHLGRRAEEFEARVKVLVRQAEDARTAAELGDDHARRLRQLLSSEIGVQIAGLTSEHNRQIEGLRKSGNKVAIWTFVGGVILGTVGNIVVAVMMG